ncbi:MAG TPA: aldehyde dehydrogenase family protein, partial [Longimicrobium sp.]
LDKAVDIGAIIDPAQLEKIRDLVEQGRSEGATLWQPSWSCPQEGCFFPPTLLTDVGPASTVAQVEIFGPVVVLMTFRTPDEAVALANNTPYGLAASVWTENINLALDIAPRIKAGTVWVNSTNLFDAASGFGGYRESGYGREGGREGLWEYVKSKWEKDQGKEGGVQATAKKGRGKTADAVSALAHSRTDAPSLPPIDRTAKLYIGGKQARPDSGYSMPVAGADGRVVGEVGLGNRKDIRNAVEAAHKASGWAKGTGHNRAQVIYYLAENLAARADEFTRRIAALTGDEGGAAREVELSIRRLYTYGAWADKWDGAVHSTPFRNVTLAMHEPIGVVAIACPDEAPLLGFVSLVAPAIAMGNSVVVIPSERHPLAATDFYQILDTSDVPGGVVNIVTGRRDELSETLAGHDDVDAMWYFGGAEGSTKVERLSTGNMKRTFVNYGRTRDWESAEQAEGPEFLRHATNVKNIWVPYGE